MIRSYPWVLLAILAILAGVDAVWVLEGRFDIDWRSFSVPTYSAVALAGLGLFYATVRKDERLSAMLFGTAFLAAFTMLGSVTNYFLLTIAGHRIDGLLAGIDRAMGIDWPMMIVWASEHRTLDLILLGAYGCVLPEIALLIPLLGWQAQAARIYSFCFAVACATIITMGFWTIFPSFGAITVYSLPPALVARTPLALGPDYAHELLRLLANGPGLITLNETKGLIGFPSFHAVLALLATWYAGGLRYVRLPIAALNGVILIATPIQGGHHAVDVLGGVVVAAIAIFAAERLTAFIARAQAEACPAESFGNPSAAPRYS